MEFCIICEILYLCQMRSTKGGGVEEIGVLVKGLVKGWHEVMLYSILCRSFDFDPWAMLLSCK